MRPPVDRQSRALELRRALARLEGLPLRPTTARAVIDAIADVPGPGPDPEPGGSELPRFLDGDPGWAVRGPAGDDPEEALGRVASQSWWRGGSERASEALESLWKHAVATAASARKLATEAARPEPERFARAGLLQSLGLWAIGAIDPEFLADLMQVRDRARRAELERAWLGRDLAAVGRDLAERWGLDALTVASCWLHADAGADLNGLADDAEDLLLLQRAHQWAERTPWALGRGPAPEPGPADARLRILTAEVQVRCGPGLLDAEASPREEAVTRRLAALRLAHEQARRDVSTRDHLIDALADQLPGEGAADCAERAARAFCAEPGVASAKAVRRDQAAGMLPTRPPSRVLRLGRTEVEVHLWTERASGELDGRLARVLPGWSAWAELLEDRDRRGARLDQAVASHRSRVERDEAADSERRLAALAEFAAGAGHELNNPLAVILGRAQLLLPRVTEPADVRALRVIIAQAQRTHRILRDLIYVARPPAPRPRLCRSDDVVRAALRDAKPEADARGVRVVPDPREAAPIAWADPEGLRHALDVLLRNALEATPTGGTIRVTTSRTGDRISWVVRDAGRGITPDEGRHLFEPFYCGRQAGRGLGLGLPRAARFLAAVGGDLTWRSSPGQGTAFAMNVPVAEPAATTAP